MRINKLKLFPLFFLFLGCFINVAAQDETPSDQTPKRSGLLAQLDLTREQIQQIRTINQQNRPQIRQANLRLKEANRNLDAAVYSDTANENDVRLRIKDVHAAHAEVVRLRAETEFAVRKILTTDQLTRFRDFREQALTEKENAPRLRNNRRLTNQNRRLNNLRRQNRPLN